MVRVVFTITPENETKEQNILNLSQLVVTFSHCGNVGLISSSYT